MLTASSNRDARAFRERNQAARDRRSTSANRRASASPSPVARRLDAPRIDVITLWHCRTRTHARNTYVCVRAKRRAIGVRWVVSHGRDCNAVEHAIRMRRKQRFQCAGIRTGFGPSGCDDYAGSDFQRGGYSGLVGVSHFVYFPTVSIA